MERRYFYSMKKRRFAQHRQRNIRNSNWFAHFGRTDVKIRRKETIKANFLRREKYKRSGVHKASRDHRKIEQKKGAVHLEAPFTYYGKPIVMIVVEARLFFA
jgi:hypothetical protein